MEQIDYCTLPVSASTAKDDKVRACDLCVRSAAVYSRTGVLAFGSVLLLLFSNTLNSKMFAALFSHSKVGLLGTTGLVYLSLSFSRSRSVSLSLSRSPLIPLSLPP